MPRNTSIIVRSLLASVGVHGILVAVVFLGGITLFFIRSTPTPPLIQLETRLQVSLPLAKAPPVEVVAPPELLPELIDSPPEVSPAVVERLDLPDFLPEKPSLVPPPVPLLEPSQPLQPREAPQEAGGLGFTPPTRDHGACPSPPYPERAVRRGWQGTAWVRVKVSAVGLPEEVVLTSSSGHSILDGAAVVAIEQWRLEPARRDGHPVPGYLLVPVRFRLRAPGNP